MIWKKCVKAEMFNEKMEVLVEMLCRAELIMFVLQAVFSFFKHPVWSVLFISVPFTEMLFHTIPQIIHFLIVALQ